MITWVKLCLFEVGFDSGSAVGKALDPECIHGVSCLGILKGRALPRGSVRWVDRFWWWKHISRTATCPSLAGGKTKALPCPTLPQLTRGPEPRPVEWGHDGLSRGHAAAVESTGPCPQRVKICFSKHIGRMDPWLVVKCMKLCRYESSPSTRLQVTRQQLSTVFLIRRFDLNSVFSFTTKTRLIFCPRSVD